LTENFVRVISVLVVATPCPLLIATPVAIMSGMSSAYKKGILVKEGGALENLSEVKNFVFDKTGTITFGLPKVVDVVALDGISELEILKVATSLDQLSTHILAKALINYSKEKKIETIFPQNFHEDFGQGVLGEVDSLGKFILGKKKYLEDKNISFSDDILDIYEKERESGKMIVFLSNTSKVLGAILFEDIVRPDSKKVFKKMQRDVELEILTGDTYSKGKLIAESLSLKTNAVIAEVTPKQKLEYIKKLQEKNKVAMVGDGVNDAPALMQADVGIALSNHEKTISGEVSDIVVLSGSLNSVLDIFTISKKTVQLAKQGIFFGMGASCVAMVLSGLGYIQPLNGAILQEFIDVVVILNALRLNKILKD
jgi:heavy metal translocating P-type ATPase